MKRMQAARVLAKRTLAKRTLARRVLGVMLVGSLALAATACGPAPSASAAKGAAQGAPAANQPAGQPVTVTLTDVQFNPSTVKVKAGTPVTITAANKGVLEHNWQVKIGNETIQVDARPGQTATRTFTPATPGTYKVVCTVAGHEQAGMTGMLVVE